MQPQALDGMIRKSDGITARQVQDFLEKCAWSFGRNFLLKTFL